MKKISFCISLLGFSVMLSAQTVQDSTEVQIKGKRPLQIESPSFRTTLVIPSKTIQESPVQTVNEILDGQIGVDVQQRGPFNTQSDLRFRGGTFDQSLLMIDGINLNTAQTGHHTMQVPGSLLALSRVEILKGAAVRQYGQSAFSGAVNLVTINPIQNQAIIGLQGGSFGYFSADAIAQYKQNAHSGFIAFNHQQSDGYIQNTDFKNTSILFKNQYETSKATWQFHTGYNRNSFGSNAFYSTKYPHQYELVNNGFINVGYENKSSVWDVKSTLLYRYLQDQFQLFRDMEEAPSWYKDHNYHYNQVVDYHLNIGRKITDNLFVTNASNFRFDHIKSSVLGDAIQGKENERYSKATHREMISDHIQLHHILNNFEYRVGVMGLFLPNQGAFEWLPGAEISYQLGHHLWSASVNKAFRMPTFTDLYYKSATNIGNPDLQPESAWDYEISYQYQSPVLYAQVSYFQKDASDLIDWVRPAPATIWETVNRTELTTQGVEARITAPIHAYLHWENQLELSLGYAWLNQDKNQEENMVSRYALDYIKNQFTAQLRIEPNKNLRWTTQYQFFDREKLPENQLATGQQNYSSYTLLNSKLQYRFKQWTFFAEGRNLLDKKYQDFIGLPQAGIYFSGGFTIQLGK